MKWLKDALKKAWNWVKKTWEKVKELLHKFVGGLFFEDKGGKQVISLGRTCFVIVFLCLMYFWLHPYPSKIGEFMALDGQKIPDGLLEVFYALGGYVLVGKGVAGFGGRRRSDDDPYL